jgi:phosphotransferase family enzyme
VITDHPDVPPIAAHRPAQRADLRSMIAAAGTSVVLLSGSRDPNAKMTVVLLDAYGPAFVAKVPTTSDAEIAVRNEAYALDALAGMPLGALSTTLPRPVGCLSYLGSTALLSTALPGTPMAVSYHGWHHTARRRHVEQDFAVAADWLCDLQSRTCGPVAPVGLVTDVVPTLDRRFADHPSLAAASSTLDDAAAGLSGYATPRTVVHGDFWFGNLLLDGGRVTGVVDWESAVMQGEPLRDIARFVVSYALYLDRHTRAGARVRGHRRLRAGLWGAGVDYLLAGDNWFSEVAQNFLTLQLGRLGLPPARWRDVVIGGLAEIAATADDPEFAAKHLQVLARAGEAGNSATGAHT